LFMPSLLRFCFLILSGYSASMPSIQRRNLLAGRHALSPGVGGASAEIGMTARTTSRTVNFVRPFILDGFAREQPAGSYVVLTEEEMMDTLLSQAWRRASTVIRLRTPAGTQDYPIDPEQL